MPRGGPTSSQILKSCMLANGGMSYPRTAIVRSSTCARSLRYSSNSLAAVWFWLNDHSPQKYGLNGTNRPFGPRGAENVQQSAAIWLIALCHREHRWRIEDQCALVGDQCAVV